MIEKTEDEIMKNWKPGEQPLLSCCCITYNHANFISQAIDGMLIQETDFPFEIIIHDDASTDGTVDIIKQYAKKYPRIIRTILQTENQYSQKKNIMAIPIKEAKGKYIASLEGDDYWIDPLKLQKQVDFLENNSDYICCYHNAMVINGKNEVIRDTYITGAKDYSREELLASDTDVHTHSVVFRNVIDYPDDLRDIPFGDMVRWHLMGFHGKAKYLPDVGKAAYRIHENGVWGQLDNLSRFEKTIFSKQRLRENLIKHHLSTDKIDESINQYAVKLLTDTLFKKEFLLYGKILISLFKNRELPSFKILNRHLAAVGKRVLKKISNILHR